MTPNITAALIALARLSLRAASGAPDEHDTVAESLLGQLMAACAGQRGALALTTQDERVRAAPARRVVRLLALSQVGEEVAHALVTTLPAAKAVVQQAPSARCWIVCSLPISEHLVAHPPFDGPAEREARPTHAALLLGWDGEPAGRIAAAEAHRRLPLLADAATMAIMSLLLAESGRELQAAARQREALLREVEQARADWEQTFNAVADPVCVVTPDYKVVRANTAYSKLFGVARGHAEGHACFAAGPGHHAPCVGCPLPRTVESRLPDFVQQERWTPTGSQGALERRMYQAWTYPVLDDQGRVDRVVEIIKDVTEQERLSQITSQAEALREADRLKAELLGTVSHELRSPLAAIKGYAATLLRHERRLPREERHEFLLAIDEASDRLETIIDRLLLMSQLETGTLTIRRAPVDIAPVASEALEATAQRVAQTSPDRFRFTMRVENAAGAPAQVAPMVSADPRHLRTVLDNLLENAVKYSPEGGAIEVWLRPVARFAEAGAPSTSRVGESLRERPMLEVRVRDSGVGIPIEHLGRIFERFHRVDTRLTRDVDGLGLGLAICKRIVELHNGEIWAESESGTGSTFHVLLPLDEADAPSAPQEDL